MADKPDVDLERARAVFGKLKLGCSHDDVQIVAAEFRAVRLETLRGIARMSDVERGIRELEASK